MGRITGARISPWTMRSTRSLTAAGSSAALPGAPGRPGGEPFFFEAVFVSAEVVFSLLLAAAVAFVGVLPVIFGDSKLVCCSDSSLNGAAFVVAVSAEGAVAFVSIVFATTALVLDFPDCATEFVPGELVLIFAEAFVPGALVPDLATAFAEGELVGA